MKLLRVTLPVLLVGAALAGAAPRDDVDLLNVALGPGYASWLIGPWGRLASDEEVREFQHLAADEEAEAWVESFWERRDPDPERLGNPVRELAEERAQEADRRFAQAGFAGRRTDRGTIFVLYGEPKEIEHEPSPIYGEPPLEHWKYPRDAEPGIDGEKPSRLYRFVQRGELTKLYVPGRPGRFTQRSPNGGSR